MFCYILDTSCYPGVEDLKPGQVPLQHKTLAYHQDGGATSLVHVPPALMPSSWRLCAFARPVRGGERSALRAGGDRRGVVCLAQRRRAAERSGVSPTIAVTRRGCWVSRADANGLEVLNARAYAELLASLRLCATCPGWWAIGSSSGR